MIIQTKIKGEGRGCFCKEQALVGGPLNISQLLQPSPKPTLHLILFENKKSKEVLTHYLI